MSRRKPLIVLGSVVLAFAALIALAGVVLAAVFGSGDALATGPHAVTSPTRALVSSVAEINGLSAAPSGLGQARIEVEATVRPGGEGAFVGVGRAADVDRYLTGADVDLVTDVEVSPFRLETQRQPGTAAVPAPGTQGFWVAQAEATSGTARLSWPVQDGDYRIVLMNADGSPGVDVDSRFAVVLPSAFATSLIVLVTGLVLALVGGVLLTLGLLAPRSAGPPSSPAPATPPLVPPPASGDTRPLVPPATSGTGSPNPPVTTVDDRNQG